MAVAIVQVGTTTKQNPRPHPIEQVFRISDLNRELAVGCTASILSAGKIIEIPSLLNNELVYGYFRKGFPAFVRLRKLAKPQFEQIEKSCFHRSWPVMDV